MSVPKTGEEIAQEVFARLAKRSETEEAEHARLTTFYFPRPDGSIGFSRYVDAKDSQAVSMHMSGVITGERAEEFRRKPPEWFENA